VGCTYKDCQDYKIDREVNKVSTAIFTVLGSIIALVLADALFGIILSIKAGKFDVRKLPQFLATNLLPYAGGLLVLALTSLFAGDYSTQVIAIFGAAALVTGAKFVAEIIDKATQIFGKLEIPSQTIDIKAYLASLDDEIIKTLGEAIVDAIQKKTTG
jgi:hypothetical protein